MLCLMFIRVRIVTEKQRDKTNKGDTNIKPLSYADVVKGKTRKDEKQ